MEDNDVRRLARIHPADRRPAVLQGVSVVMVAGWSAVTTYGAAQTWGWLPGWAEVAVAGLGAAGAAAAAAAGLLGARLAGQQDMRQAIEDRRIAAAVERPAPALIGRHRRALPAGTGRNEPPAFAASVKTPGEAGAARRSLVNTSPKRYAPPAGLTGPKRAAAELLAGLPAAVDVVGDVYAPAEPPAPAVDQDGPLVG
ncbi:hypothetical protein [Micromonospora sp. RP3T]|uniref:hypothetical protein n=1 Tax=Micromonospora sp. RP3T TaxID=2135446 RepID=UPI003D75F8AD